MTGNAAGCASFAEGLVGDILQDQNEVTPSSTVGGDLAALKVDAEGVDGGTGDVPSQLSTDASQLQSDNTAALASNS